MPSKELFEMARKAAENAVCNESGFPVGAALLCEDGRIFTGANVESPSIIQVFCAERVALVKALSEGARKFAAIAVHTPKSPGVPPCGVCRQMLWEFAPDITVIIEKDGELSETPLADLLPDAFSAD